MAGIWTIPPHRPFLDTLVAGIFARFGRDPIALAEISILLPSRRACRALRDAFLRASGGACLLLPRLSALGDIDADEIDLAAGEALPDNLDLPPAITKLRRQLLLARLVRQLGRSASGTEILPGQAVALADDLARLIDQVHTERISFDGLAGLVQDDLAVHWQVTVDFLKIASEHWPVILAAEGTLDPADRRNRLVAAQSAAWRARPPDHPILAAGFGTAVPAAADLLSLIALLPSGSVILPGVDRGADAALWAAIEADPTHPQFGLAQLLAVMGAHHDDLDDWPAPDGPAGPPERVTLAREIMRPAAETHRWRDLGIMPPEATRGLSRLDLAGQQEEAGAIALMLREQLDIPGATAMLITPDRGLARRVVSELARWQIDIDDSAGIPLNHTAPGLLLRLLAEAAQTDLAPVPLLALLKHPLVAIGMTSADFREGVRGLERRCLRGPRPAAGLDGLRAAARDSAAALLPLIERLAWALGPFMALIARDSVALTDVLTAHLTAAERLAATEAAPDGAPLWALEAGASLAGFVAELAEASGDFEPIRGRDYPVLFETLIGGRVVRPQFGKHPRLQLLGALEARLLHADLVVLGGLNEGVWPGQAPHDPWMSRPMRRDFGLGSPEAMIGLAAHDFMMGFTAPQVVLTRAARAEGTPTVPSRWLLRLDTVLRAAPNLVMPYGGRSFDPFRAWQALLDKPPAIQACAPPAPCPPLAARPRKLSVTEIETWMRDPYAIYARHVLGLRALDPLDDDPGAADRGMIIHEALDGFVRTYPGSLPADALDRLIAIGRNAFGESLVRPGVWAFWWPRFLRIAAWFIETEAARRPLLAESRTEAVGTLVLVCPGGDFTLTAKADRIDRLRVGGLALIDYKTGAVPKSADVILGFSPQLPLEAAMAEAGGFAGIAAAEIIELAFWRLSGTDPAGKIEALGSDETGPSALAAAARLGLIRLIERFDDPATAYRARPRPDRAPRYSDYTHLARLAEWGTEIEL